MNFYFDTNHPPALIKALELIQNLDGEEEHLLKLYNTSINDDTLNEPIFCLVDDAKKGIEEGTRELFKRGFRIFVIKFPKLYPYDSYDISIAIIGLWPILLGITKEHKEAFVYKYFWKTQKIKKTKL